MTMKVPSRAPSAPVTGGLKVSKIQKRGHFIGLYGAGGVGKTTLSMMLPGKSLVFDLERSMGMLVGMLAELGINEGTGFDVCTATSFEELLTQLNAPSADYAGYDNIIIDSFTRAQELAAEECMRTIAGDSPAIKDSLEQWMYGKGAQLVFDRFRPIYSVIERHLLNGRNVLAIAHNEPAKFVNPDGSDFYQNQPRLIQGERGKAPSRYVFSEKCDHLLYLSYDIEAVKGKAQGGGTRSLYTSGGDGRRMAKSRTVQGSNPRFDINEGEVFDWSQILK